MMQLTPLDPSRLSPAAQRALGPGPGRTMAARGLLPLAPADQVAVLYQLSLDAESSLALSARATAAGLPEKLLAGTLTAPSTDPRILDFFAQLIADKPAVFDAIALNPSVADQTIATLAARAASREVDLIAQNEQRLLRHPEIIAAMYLNRRARMSTIDRVVELAVRNSVRVPGLAAWDEVARALTGSPPASPEADAMFAAMAQAARDDSVLTTGDAEQALPEDEAPVTPPETEDETERKLTIPMKIRLATLGDAFERARRIRDPARMVAMAAIKAPGVTDIEAARYAGNQALAEDVIRYIAGNRNWTKLYGVKVSLCRNPKAPISETTRFLPFLRQKDLVNLSKSKGVPSALTAQARKLVMQRSGK
ncbi:MAG: hypothetical protein E6J90_45590 [Deltaproteobacteria bacterium]|nr:MAG: hypothetical protein E6J91_38135 [Deltaproteobacteria bacterium]TMQ06705.1 MAG: hypothetical protein E6J90_45590 [Deltaproteobacteria bacterium]